MIQNPHDRWLRHGAAAALFIAVLAGWSFHAMQRDARSIRALDGETRKQLAALKVHSQRTVKIEQEWVAKGFETKLLIAPPGPLPCTAGSSSEPVAALIAATNLANGGRYAEAERIATEALTKSDFADVSETACAVYLHHIVAFARLSRDVKNPQWASLTNVTRLIGGRRSIAPPGCARADSSSLSSSDLFNNLMVAFMEGNYRALPRERLKGRDFLRPDSAFERFFYAQVARAPSNGWQDESRLFALAVIGEAIEEDMLDDARFNVNAIMVLDWWIAPEHCPSAICTADVLDALQVLRDSLLKRAFLARMVPPQQRVELARALTRLLARSTFDRSSIEGSANLIRGWLPPAEAETLDALLVAGAARADYSWLREPSEDNRVPFEKLGRRANVWRSAARKDFVADAARMIVTWEASDRRRVALALLPLIDDSEVPPELGALIAQLSIRDRVIASRWWSIAAGVTAAALIWLALVWILVQLWELRMQRTSFYKTELEQLRSERHD